eukprot:TRINITY_DN64953_c0_g1_i1.p1 TRINITY_DN64953_c0_g1~~TRINITY_DN64953_c0_g1_i1.p1  ORF type:complete len:325 (+),score=64.92 TRINITY_DN64953_c0_g1_i1:41-1015(+)
MDHYDPFAESPPPEDPAVKRQAEEADADALRKRARVLRNSGGDDGKPPPLYGCDGRPRTNKAAPELIGQVRALRDPTKRALCMHFLQNDCLWGDKCRFSHSVDELRQGAPETTRMDFRSLDAGRDFKKFDIPREQVDAFMTDETKRLIVAATGVQEVSWERETKKVIVSGALPQLEQVELLIKRVTTHCKWGVSASKVRSLLSCNPCSAARLCLNPMVTTLKQANINLTEGKPQISIGADPGSDLTIRGPLISRTHVVIEFMPNKGALYVADMSTNGTYLNGVRLPAKGSGKVVLSHGDELLFPEPDRPVNSLEFGYMVNIEFR